MISNEFVRLMGGEITIDSEEGVGTTVEFTTVMKTTKDFLMKEETEPRKEIEKLTVDTEPEVKIIPEVEEKVNEEEKPQPVKSDPDLGDIPLGDESEVPVEIDHDDDDQSFDIPVNHKKRLLLVEDNPISQKVEKKLLSDSGYEVEAVSSALDAIEAVKTNSFDLVLMDVEMPDMDGLTATQKIRQLEPPSNKIPIIAVTAHSSMKDREKCLASGMNDYIAKPININFMKMTIDQWLMRD
jgi:CheY-like chemotaxis protein